MKTKAIIFDLDGTAVDSPVKKIPTQDLVDQIERLKDDYYFCAATGRVWSFAKLVLTTLKLTDPCIISAGTQICDPQTGKILWQKNVDPGLLMQAVEVLKDYPEYRILYNDGTLEDYFHGGISPLDFNSTDPVYFFEQVFIPNAIATEIYARLSKITGLAIIMVVAQKPGCNDIHIINKEATKEQAIAELLKMISLERENTIGVGDGNNDIHLFNAVNLKVAMGNSVDIIKKAADKIIGSVSEDGMVEYLKTLKPQL
jgi:HAD superfamily hydrolase (TIGR01484 family)